jgi:P-type E1-E2 ATPase
LVEKAQEDFIPVFRGSEGLSTTIPTPELVVGDVIEISQGMRVPADCVLISGIDIECDEAAMTGEPDTQEKVHVDENTYKLNPSPFLLA